MAAAFHGKRLRIVHLCVGMCGRVGFLIVPGEAFEAGVELHGLGWFSRG